MPTQNVRIFRSIFHAITKDMLGSSILIRLARACMRWCACVMQVISFVSDIRINRILDNGRVSHEFIVQPTPKHNAPYNK